MQTMHKSRKTRLDVRAKRAAPLTLLSIKQKAFTQWQLSESLATTKNQTDPMPHSKTDSKLS